MYLNAASDDLSYGHPEVRLLPYPVPDRRRRHQAADRQGPEQRHSDEAEKQVQLDLPKGRSG